MTDTTGHSPYPFDFFETLKAIHFPTGAVLLDITASSVIEGGTVPACSSVALRLPAGAKLIDKRETFSKVVTPPSIITKRNFFIWDGVAPFPTTANYLNVVFSGSGFPPQIGYAAQFSQFVRINTADFAPPVFSGQNIGGFYNSLAEVNDAAAALRALLFGGHPAGSTMGYFTAAGVRLLNGGALQDPFGAELDVLQPVAGSASCSLHGLYLISVPTKLSTITATVTTPGSGSVNAVAEGFHAGGIKTVAQAQAATPDSSGSGSTPEFSGVGPLITATSAKVDGQTQVTLNVASGGIRAG